jgi:Family of unknown function (DUF6913)
MLEFLKEKIAEKVIEKHLKDQKFEPYTFSGFIKSSYSFFVEMPEDDRDFTYSLSVLNFLADNKKSAMTLARDFKVSLLPQKFKARAISYSEKDITKWKLPARHLIEKVGEMPFNVAIDLNRKDSFFHNYIANIVKAPLKIGFVKNDSDKFYNFQVINHGDNPEISYQNFLNCLKMFQD